MNSPAPQPIPRLSGFEIRGFRSLRDVRVENLPGVAVLIGANGAGKSSLIRFFEMLSWMLKSRSLAIFVGLQGGGSDQLFGGARRTSRMSAQLTIETDRGPNDYRFTLVHAAPDRLIFTEEGIRPHNPDLQLNAGWHFLPPGQPEAGIVEFAQSAAGTGINEVTARTIVHFLRGCTHYQFHDTSLDSPLRTRADIHDNAFLRSDGGNLAAVLYRLQQKDPRRYKYICQQITRVLPVFDTFDLDDEYGNVLLRWRARDTGQIIGPHLTSDGSLRFFALATLLNLPRAVLPPVILLDEPELGLHPSAVDLIAHMIRSLGTERQIIVATQSPLFVDAFDLDQVIVCETDGSASTLETQDPSGEKWQAWLEEYTVGQLWETNLLGGHP